MTAILRPGTLKVFMSSGRLRRSTSSPGAPGNSTAICSTRCRRAEGWAGFAESLADMPAPRNPTRMSVRLTCLLMSFTGMADMKVPFRLESLVEWTAQDIEQGLIQPIQTEQGGIGKLEFKPS